MFLERFFFCNLWSVVLICLMLGLKWLLRNRLSMRFHYVSWYILLLSMLLSFLPAEVWEGVVPGKPISQQTFAIAGAGAKTAANVPLSNEWIHDTTELMYSADNNQAIFIVLTIWLIGALMLLSVYWCGSHRLRMIRRYALPSSPQNQLIFERCCAALHLNKCTVLRQSRSITSPISFGVKTAFVVLPTDKVDSLSESQLEHIILHELTHIRHGDLISNYLICFIQALFWFNPFVWIAFRQMRRDREAYCDWDVLNGLDTEADRINYGQTVLHFAAMCHTRFDTANGLCQSKSQIKYRLEHIVGFQYETAWKKVAGRCFVCLLVLATLFQIPALAYCSDFSEDYYNLPESLSITQADWSEEFQGADGCGIIYDLNANQYTAYHQDEITRRMPPCSTYKIYSLLNALEQGVITPEENTLLWDGTTYDYAAWNHDQNIDTAMKSSVNWYFERLDDMVGFQQTKAFFQEIGFGSGNPSNDPGSLWNGTGIKISAFEQVELLVKLYRNDFNFAEENITAVKNAMEITSNDTSRLYGKTGTGCADDQNIAGWFIGFVETNDNTYFFAFYLNSNNGADGEAAYHTALSVLESWGIQ